MTAQPPHLPPNRPDWSPTRQSARRARAPLPDQVDVAVVGAGLGGLTAAAWLARAGLRVACLDGHYVAGGCATQFQRRGPDGRYTFDVGLHYIGDCGPDGMIPRLLAGVGVDLSYRSLDPDGFDTLVFPDFTFRIPADVDVYRDRLVALFPRERRGVDRYVAMLRQLADVGVRIERNGGRLSPRLLLDVALRGRLLARFANGTIGAFLDTCTRDPQLRAVLCGQSGDYGLPPSQVSAVLHLGLANHYFRGAYYPVGGGQAIADHLADAIEAADGGVYLRRPVSRIDFQGGRAAGVQAEARHGQATPLRARAVLSNADLKRTLLELVGPDHLPSDWIRRAEGFRMAGAIFITFLGVKADMSARGMRATNYWQFDDYDLESFYTQADPAHPRGCYITSASRKEPDNPHHAPPGVESVEVMTLVPGDPARWGGAAAAPGPWGYKKASEYQDLKARVEADMVARFDRLFPGSARDVVFRESATPLTHARFTGATGGTGYGLAASPDQFLRNRPGYRGPLPGLYLCGASTRSGHGIVGAMMSGYEAAKRIAADLAVTLPPLPPG